MIYLHALAVLAALGAVSATLLLIADRFLANYGPCAVRINDQEAFTVQGGVRLLEALYQQRIFIPSACGGQGTCGFCKVQVPEGGGPVLPTELPYLTQEEVGNGTRLACQVKIKQDILTLVKEEFLNVEQYEAVVTGARMVTHDTRELRLKLLDPQEIEFRPGQYVQVQVPNLAEPTYRAYSISSSPRSRNEIELLIRLVHGGLCSTYLHGVAVDDKLVFTGPYGEFALDEDEDNELICVGGGCGMAPMRSILRHVRDVAPNRACWLFFGARTDQDVMYLDEFRQMQKNMPNFRIHYALSEPQHSTDWQDETGFIHESVARHVGTQGKRQAFLCGPPVMVEATINVLQDKSIPRDRVFYDEF